MTSRPCPIAVLISGGGTTLKNLIDRADRGHLPVDIRTVISSHRQARGLEFARSALIPTHIVERRLCASATAFRDAVFDICRAVEVELVVMAGFLKHLLIPADFAGRVMNIHPSLIPQFCGKGYYGQHVHAAVLNAGTPTTGCTVHFVDDQYDHGPIILQREVPVLPDDNVRSLAARVFTEECQALPEAIRLFAAGRLEIHGNRVVIAPASG